MAGGEVGAKSEDRGAAILMELQHFYRIAEVEVEGLVGVQDVHFGEGAGLEEIVDGGGGGADAAGKVEGCGSGVGAAEGAAFEGVGLEVEEGLDLLCGHKKDGSRAGLRDCQAVGIRLGTIELWHDGAGLYSRVVQGLPGGEAVS